MLCRMRDYESSSREVSRHRSDVRRSIESLAKAGHEIGLHVHPHWQATRWTGDSWDFSGTRYSPAQFRRSELVEIFKSYSNEIAETVGTRPTTYRAGGFCIEPFEKVGDALRAIGIQTDSSIVPGTYLNDYDKRFDFRRTPDAPWWFFDDVPTVSASEGRFLEVPISSIQLSPFYYWGRLVDRLLRRQPARVYGDGFAKPIGYVSAIRRLLALERTVELSTDAPKARRMTAAIRGDDARKLHHVMGHPKLLAKSSLDALRAFIDRQGIKRFETVDSLARKIRHGLVA